MDQPQQTSFGIPQQGTGSLCAPRGPPPRGLGRGQDVYGGRGNYTRPRPGKSNYYQERTPEWMDEELPEGDFDFGDSWEEQSQNNELPQKKNQAYGTPPGSQNRTPLYQRQGSGGDYKLASPPATGGGQDGGRYPPTGGHDRGGFNKGGDRNSNSTESTLLNSGISRNLEMAPPKNQWQSQMGQLESYTTMPVDKRPDPPVPLRGNYPVPPATGNVPMPPNVWRQGSPAPHDLKGTKGIAKQSQPSKGIFSSEFSMFGNMQIKSEPVETSGSTDKYFDHNMAWLLNLQQVATGSVPTELDTSEDDVNPILIMPQTLPAPRPPNIDNMSDADRLHLLCPALAEAMLEHNKETEQEVPALVIKEEPNDSYPGEVIPKIVVKSEPADEQAEVRSIVGDEDMDICSQVNAPVILGPTACVDSGPALAVRLGSTASVNLGSQSSAQSQSVFKTPVIPAPRRCISPMTVQKNDMLVTANLRLNAEQLGTASLALPDNDDSASQCSTLLGDSDAHSKTNSGDLLHRCTTRGSQSGSSSLNKHHLASPPSHARSSTMHSATSESNMDSNSQADTDKSSLALQAIDRLQLQSDMTSQTGTIASVGTAVTVSDKIQLDSASVVDNWKSYRESASMRDTTSFAETTSEPNSWSVHRYGPHMSVNDILNRVPTDGAEQDEYEMDAIDAIMKFVLQEARDILKTAGVPEKDIAGASSEDSRQVVLEESEDVIIRDTESDQYYETYRKVEIPANSTLLSTVKFSTMGLKPELLSALDDLGYDKTTTGKNSGDHYSYTTRITYGCNIFKKKRVLLSMKISF